MPLKIAAKVDRADQAYWNEHIWPMVKAHPNVEFIGEINEHDKARFLDEAAALLFPVNWPEPFGLVMIEAMACGNAHHCIPARFSLRDPPRGHVGLHRGYHGPSGNGRAADTELGSQFVPCSNDGLPSNGWRMTI
jgi:hypothetical protein